MVKKVLAKLELKLRETPTDTDWITYKTYNLTDNVVRLGRGANCEVSLIIPEHKILSQAISRYHATLFYYPGELDYFIQDGTPGTPTTENPNPEPILSVLGVCINTRAQKLEPKQKYKLKNLDEIHLIFSRLKLVYIREQKSISEKLLDDTFIPPEYLL